MSLNNKRSNKSGIPININRNGELLKKCESIQEAGRFLKEVSEDTNFRFSRIENGYIYGDSWSFNGNTFTFTTTEAIRLKRKAELENRGK